MKKTVHILYAGLGGHGEYVMNLVDNDTSNLKFVFFGVEPVRKEYVDYCQEKNIDFSYIKKTKGLRWMFQFVRLIMREKNACFLVHSSIALIPILIGKSLGFGKKSKVIFVEHQPNHLKTKMDWRCSKLANKSANKTVFLTQESLDEVRDFIGAKFKTANTLIISTGVDSSFWKNERRTQSSNHLVLGMQARMMATKNFQCLISAAALLVQQGNKNLQLRLAGDGDLRPELEKMVAELEMQEHVKFEGMLGRVELQRFMSELNIYIHSTKGETFSTSILQAMSMRLPIIASDVKGVQNILTNQTTALLFQDGDITELAQKINELSLDAELQKKLSENAYRLVEQKYTLEAMRQQYKNIMN